MFFFFKLSENINTGKMSIIQMVLFLKFFPFFFVFSGFIFPIAHNSFALTIISQIQKHMVVSRISLLFCGLLIIRIFSLVFAFHSQLSVGGILIHFCSGFSFIFLSFLHLNAHAPLVQIYFLSDCVLYAVGKPVYHKSMNVTYGSWLKDAQPRGKVEKIWTTYETDHDIIYQFDDKTEFRNNKAKEIHRLKLPGFQVHSRFEKSIYNI